MGKLVRKHVTQVRVTMFNIKTRPVGDRVEVKDVNVVMSLLREGYFVRFSHEDNRMYMQILEPTEKKDEQPDTKS